MNIHRIIFRYTIFTVLCCLRLLAKGDDKVLTEVQKQVSEFKTVESQVSYLSALISPTNNMINSNDIRKAAAITLLGNIGTSNAISLNAISLLVTNLNFTDKRNNNIPASHALAVIGERAVPELLKVFQNSSDNEQIRRAAQTLALIKGDTYKEFVKQEKDKMPREIWDKLSNAP